MDASLPLSVAPLVISAMSLLAIFALFGPFRALVLRKATHVERIHVNDNPAQRDIAFLLIHGTFARKAPWTAREGKFVEKLIEASNPKSIDRLLWSGDNSTDQRVNAADEVTRWICQQGSARVVLIGHSHGGAIAALAASRAQSQNVLVLTMATPYISAQQRYPGLFHPGRSRYQRLEERRLYLGMIIVLFLLSSIVWGYVASGIAGIAIALFGTIASCLLSADQPKWLKKRVLRDLRTLARQCEHLVASTTTLLDSDRLVIMRTAGDEATGLLTVSQISTWLTSAVLRSIGVSTRLARLGEERSESSLRRIISAIWRNRLGKKILIVYLVAIGFIYWAPKIFSSPTKPGEYDHLVMILVAPVTVLVAVSARIISTAIESILVLVGVILSFVINLPFGVELASRAMLLSLTTEATPLGAWKVHISKHGGPGLAHSALYQSDLIAHEVKERLGSGLSEA